MNEKLKRFWDRIKYNRHNIAKRAALGWLIGCVAVLASMLVFTIISAGGIKGLMA